MAVVRRGHSRNARGSGRPGTTTTIPAVAGSSVSTPAVDWPELRSATVVFENADVLALDEPPHLSVTGERGEPDIVDMAAGAGETLYPVHRIDKVTSGLVLLAKTLAAHGPLTRQFAARTVRKGYLVVVRATGLPSSWSIDLPLSVGRKNRVRVAGMREAITFDQEARRWQLGEPVASDRRSYPSLTVVHRLDERDGLTALLARPVTGRRHQIRVHLAWTGSPVLGDPLFPSTSLHREYGRTYLHSWQLQVDAPWAPGRPTDLSAPPDPSFFAPLGSHPGAGDTAGTSRAVATAQEVWAAS